jgi:hypothetical protein
VGYRFADAQMLLENSEGTPSESAASEAEAEGVLKSIVE